MNHNEIQSCVDIALSGLDNGSHRIAEKINGKWIVNDWLKQAILLAFRCQPNQRIEGKPTHFYDKLKLKFENTSEESFKQQQIRCVPPATVRFGSYIGKRTILMPCFVNIGAYIDDDCMIDTWATVGSCAQIGKRVHISGGAGIGGVLEPLQATPTIIEDNVFIGARSEIVEGVIVEENSVISMGVFIGQSTPIYDRSTDSISYGRVPAGSVVIPGSIPSKNGRYGRSAAIIVKQIDEKTRKKTNINELLREACV